MRCTLIYTKNKIIAYFYAIFKKIIFIFLFSGHIFYYYYG